MRKSIRRLIVAGAAAIGLSAALMAGPAEAGVRFGGGGGGWHGGGFGGWHGGGFGGFRGGGFGGFRRGYGGYGYGGYGYGGWGYPWWGYAGWGYPGWGWDDGWGSGPDVYYVGGDSSYYPGSNACWQYRRVWSLPGGRGRYLGRHPVNVCQ
jgi:hypothetical protein